MKTKARFLLLATLIVSTACVLLAADEAQKAATQEVSGTIKEVSINVRRLTVELSERQEKIVCVEPEQKSSSTVEKPHLKN